MSLCSYQYCWLAVGGRCCCHQSDGQWRAGRFKLRADTLKCLLTQYVVFHFNKIFHLVLSYYPIEFIFGRMIVEGGIHGDV